jgi:hypothetical protein
VKTLFVDNILIKHCGSPDKFWASSGHIFILPFEKKSALVASCPVSYQPMRFVKLMVSEMWSIASI